MYGQIYLYRKIVNSQIQTRKLVCIQYQSTEASNFIRQDLFVTRLNQIYRFTYTERQLIVRYRLESQGVHNISPQKPVSSLGKIYLLLGLSRYIDRFYKWMDRYTYTERQLIVRYRLESQCRQYQSTKASNFIRQDLFVTRLVQIYYYMQIDYLNRWIDLLTEKDRYVDTH